MPGCSRISSTRTRGTRSSMPRAGATTAGPSGRPWSPGREGRKARRFDGQGVHRRAQVAEPGPGRRRLDHRGRLQGGEGDGRRPGRRRSVQRLRLAPCGRQAHASRSRSRSGRPGSPRRSRWWASGSRCAPRSRPIKSSSSSSMGSRRPRACSATRSGPRTTRCEIGADLGSSALDSRESRLGSWGSSSRSACTAAWRR